MNLAFRCKTAEQFKILAGVADKPGQSKYNMGDRPGARTARRGGGGGMSGTGAAGVGAETGVVRRSLRSPALPNLFKGFGTPTGRNLSESADLAESFASLELDFSTVSQKVESKTERQRELDFARSLIGQSGSSVSVVCACATTITPQALVQAGMSPL